MQVTYAGQPFPESWPAAVFLAGPTPRSAEVPSWRPEALDRIAAAGFDGVVFVPEPASGGRFPEHDDQAEWERQGLNLADRILFWVPRELQTMPAFTTNIEFGRYCTSGKVVLGFPLSAPRNRYLAWLGSVEGVPVHHDLGATVAAALEGLGEGIERRGGERWVPLHVWRTEAFQSWYRALHAAGNRLDEAQLMWSFRRPDTRSVFAHVLRVRVWVAQEKRHKHNEWVLSRPDVACVVLYHRPEGADLLGTQLLLVREFRSAGRTADGFVHELPGGSHAESDASPRDVAVAEVSEETGLLLAPERLRPIASRQVAATLASHHGHVFAAELTAEEMAALQQRADTGAACGVADDTERTFVESVTLGELLQSGLADWATVGMVAQALLAGA